MGIEKVGAVPPEEPRGKKASKYGPDSKAFRELMKIGKTREVDIEEHRKKKKKGVPEEEEEDKVGKEPTHPSTSDVYYYKEQEKEAPEKPHPEEKAPKTSPQSPSFYKQMQEQKIDPSQEKEMLRIIDKELKTEKKAPKGKKISPTIKEEMKKPSIEKKPKIPKATISLEKEKPISEEAKKIKKASLYIPKEEALKKETDIKKEKAIKPPTFSKAEEKAKEKPLKEKLPLEEKLPSLKKEKKEEELFIPSYQTMILPANIQAQAQEITSKVSPTLHHEIIPLFNHMIGTIINIENKGISETQIILNNPEFTNSRFFNSKIIFEKYATAPDSYNIRLTGSQEAVTIFNENIEGLYKALSKADLDFEVGRLSAEYEFYRPLFKRKTFAGDIDKETGEKKE